MSNPHNPRMDYVPDPRSQHQPQLPPHHLAPNAMSYPNPNLNPNVVTYANPHSNPHLAYSVPPPDPSMYPNPAMMQVNRPPISSPNEYPTHTHAGGYPHPAPLPVPTQSQNIHVKPDFHHQRPPVAPPVSYPDPNALPAHAPAPTSVLATVPVLAPNPAPVPLSAPPPTSASAPIPPTSIPTPVSSFPDTNIAPIRALNEPTPLHDPTPMPKAEALPPPETVSPPHPTPVVPPPPDESDDDTIDIPFDSAAPETTAAGPETSPSTSSPPAQTQSTLPDPSKTLAGKLSEKLSRGKRHKTSPEKTETPRRSSKRAKTQLAPDSTVSTSMEVDTEFPKEFLIANAYTDRLRFNNEVAVTLYRKEYSRYSSKDEFQKYLAAQQKWRWELYNIVSILDTRVHNLTANKNSGIAQNVIRYSHILLNYKSDDVRRCEKTAKELEKMVIRIEQTRAEMLMRRSVLFDESEDPVQGEVEFVDQMVDKINLLKVNVESFLTKVNDTLRNICKKFTTEAVEAAELRRQKRRQKENQKKTRKRQERQLEKKVIDVLLRLVSKEVAERVLTRDSPTTAAITLDELDKDELEDMDGLDETAALHAILVREYLDEDASKLVKALLASCS